MKYLFYIVLVFLIFKLRTDFIKFRKYQELKEAKEALLEKQRQEWFQLETNFLSGKIDAFQHQVLAHELEKRHLREQEALRII